MHDLDHSTVEVIAEGHDEAAANDCFSQLLPEQIQSAAAVGVDMSSALAKSVKGNIPLGKVKIVHDRFHVMKLVNEAIDKRRKKENPRLRCEGK